MNALTCLALVSLWLVSAAACLALTPLFFLLLLRAWLRTSRAKLSASADSADEPEDRP